MSIENMTIGEFRELQKLFNKNANQDGLNTLNKNANQDGLNTQVGKKVIIRTYTAGVFFGELVEKFGNEVILKNARRIYYWKTTDKGLSLSEVANTGLHKDSKVCSPTELIWMQAIEIISCSEKAIKSIEGQDEYKA